ncbi:DUF4198 domain-containing protein [Sulfitobacter sp. SK012]|uniref:DUF4198 domain-containing protein n=1 Tax=Sulfitobacter sp. SK012 TaxID=1389005 RepID=UPI000E0C3173|nr:DUF4198 domain-containing protein [Sulfitobacter sp. SK012]AXI46761.1 DUF4198 domain-containing protein [Sulfitobacter sp. SK012]
MNLLRLFTVCTFVMIGSVAIAHELWVEPLAYQVDTGKPVFADIRNGQDFKGTDLAFFEKRNTRMDAVFGDKVTTIPGRMGDSPAIQFDAPESEGLLVIAHEAAPSNITYSEWEKFLAFAKHKDFPLAAADHKAAGWSMEKFTERYTRHAKALIAVGDGEGADRELGLEVEFVALTNPYADGFDGQMQVALFYQGAPLPDAQVEVFDRAPDQSVSVTLHRTGADGQATIPVDDAHTYLFDHVVLRPSLDAGETPKSPVWETLWAALTFAVPQ